MFACEPTRFEYHPLGGRGFVRHTQSPNRRCWHALLRGPVAAATGLGLGSVARTDHDRLSRAHGAEDFARLPPEASPADRAYPTFVRHYHEGDPSRVADLLEAADGALVIGFELAPSTLRHIDARGGAYLSLMNHPYRFLDDLGTVVGSNRPEAIEALMPWALRPAEVEAARDQTIAMAAMRVSLPDWLPSGTVLVAGQLGADGSVVARGRFLTLRDEWPALLARCRAAPFTIIAPHPLGGDAGEPERALLAELGGRGMISRLNPYGLIADGRVTEVIALSSSLLAEAECFGVRATALLRPPWKAEFGFAATVSLPGNAVRAVAPWRAVAGALGLPVMSGEVRPEPPMAPLRAVVGLDWGLGGLKRARLGEPVPRVVDLAGLATACDTDEAFVEAAFPLLFDRPYHPWHDDGWHVRHVGQIGRTAAIKAWLGSEEAVSRGVTGL